MKHPRLPLILVCLGVLLNLPVALLFFAAHAIRDEGFQPLTWQDGVRIAGWIALSLLFGLAWRLAEKRRDKILTATAFVLLDAGPWAGLLLLRWLA